MSGLMKTHAKSITFTWNRWNNPINSLRKVNSWFLEWTMHQISLDMSVKTISTPSSLLNHNSLSKLSLLTELDYQPSTFVRIFPSLLFTYPLDNDSTSTSIWGFFLGCKDKNIYILTDEFFFRDMKIMIKAQPIELCIIYDADLHAKIG